MTKRAFDGVVSAVFLVLLAPILALISLLVLCEDGLPIIYRGTRAGRYGRPIQVAKFRTMVKNAEDKGGSSTSCTDPRITRVGAFLRRHKLDELPQLWTVLAGDMSLVGPRPEVMEYVEMYTHEETAILQLRPGLTDWATLWNVDEGAALAGEADPDAAYIERIRPTKLKLQLEYARRHTLIVDLKILAWTLVRIIDKGRTPKEIRQYPSPIRSAQ